MVSLVSGHRDTGSCAGEGAPKKSVLVIGAGLAGLNCAKILHQAGLYDVQVIEARDRIGGRVFTRKDPNQQSIEMGANWIHGHSVSNPLFKFTEPSSPHYLQGTTGDDESLTIFRDGKKLNLMDQLSLNLQKIRIETSLFRVFNAHDWKLPDPPYSEMVSRATEELTSEGLDDDQRQMIELAKEFLLEKAMQDSAAAPSKMTTKGNSACDTSVWTRIEPKRHPGENLLVHNGMDTILPYYSEGLNISLETPVKKISSLNNQAFVTVTHHQEKKTLVADYVVVAVPLGVLKSDSIVFEPPLSTIKTEAIKGLGMGNVHKVFLTFDKAFWAEEGDNTSWIAISDSTSKEHQLFQNQHAVNSSSTTLIARFIDDKAEATQNMSDQELKDLILPMLSTHYPDCTEAHLTSIISMPWGKETYTQGAYSYIPVGSSILQVKDFSLPEGNLLFAGEHTSLYKSTMHGALESGERAAQQILQMSNN